MGYHFKTYIDILLFIFSAIKLTFSNLIFKGTLQFSFPPNYVLIVIFDMLPTVVIIEA